MHDHENEQVYLALQSKLTVITESTEVTLAPNDSVHRESWESHRIENRTDGLAVGIDVFAPGRSFDFWTDRE